jgi:hypothetical protein
LVIHAVGVPDIPKGKAWSPRASAAPTAPDQPLFDPPNQRIPCVRIDGPIETR